MNRSFLAALAISLAPFAADARTVDIGNTQELDAIQASNPALYEKLTGILQLAGNVSCETLPQMLEVQYDARRVQCSGALIRTSYPAKRWLAFKLEETAFAGNLVLTGKPPTLQKAKAPRPTNRATPLPPP